MPTKGNDMLNKIKILKILSVLILISLSLVIGESVIIHGHVYDYDTGNPIQRCECYC